MNVFPTWLPWECSNPSNLKVLLKSIHETYLYFLPYGIPIGMPLITTVQSALKILMEKLNYLQIQNPQFILPNNIRDCQLLYSKLVPALPNLTNPNIEVQAAFMALCLENLSMAVTVDTPVNPQKVKRLLNIHDFNIYFQNKVKEFQDTSLVRDKSLNYVPYYYWLENFNTTDVTQQIILQQMQDLANQTRLPLKSILQSAEISTVPNDNNEYSIVLLNIN